LSAAFDPQLHSIRDATTGYLRAAGLGGLLQKELPPLLERGERVEVLAICTPAGSWRQELRTPQVLAATDRRLVITTTAFLLADLSEKSQERQVVSIPYRSIRHVEERLGWVESKLDIEVDQTPIHLTSMRRKDARATAEAVRRRAPVIGRIAER
jgi:hypothetical protein